MERWCPAVILALAVLCGGTTAIANGGGERIDIMKAKGLMQKSRRGEPLTTDEQAYLDRARAMRGQASRRAPGADGQGEADEANSKARLVPPSERNVVYGTAGGQSLLLDVFRPKASEGPRPAVIFIHGGGFRGGDKSQFSWYANQLAGKGYVAFSINYRLAPKNLYPAAVDDCQRAVRWVRANAAEYGIDPNRIGAAGSSAGGHLVAMLGTCETLHGTNDDLDGYSSKVNCVVNYFGPTDFRPAANSPRAVQALANFLGKTAAEAPELYAEASPITHVGKDSAPCLSLHGSSDTSIPIAQSEKLTQALAAAGVEAALVTIEGAGHGFHNQADSENAQKAWQAAVAFFDRHLQPQRTE